MTADLPGSPKPVLDGIVVALNEGKNGRDHRIAVLALTYLETRHRRFYYLTQEEINGGLVLPRSTGKNDMAFERLRWESSNALLDILWVMGVTTRRPSGVKAPSGFQRARNVMPLRDGTSWEVTFPCLVCGRSQCALVGTKGPFTCPECASQYRLRLNDGTRVAFLRLPEADKCSESVKPTPFQEALDILEASADTPFEVLKKKHRTLLKQYHPDMVASIADVKLSEAAEKITTILNGAWEVVEQQHG